MFVHWVDLLIEEGGFIKNIRLLKSVRTELEFKVPLFQGNSRGSIYHSSIREML